MEAQPAAGGYPVQFDVAYPDRDLNRLTTFFRIFWAIPIFIVLGALGGHYGNWGSHEGGYAAGGASILVFAPLLMILFRQKYPRWWYDWNLEILRFTNRVFVYLALMDDTYPSTDEEQSVSLNFPYPDAKEELNRWLPLVKWLLAIPHLIVLVFLWLAAIVCTIFACFVTGVFRWSNRVTGYAFALVTDEYPPFRLSP